MAELKKNEKKGLPYVRLGGVGREKPTFHSERESKPGKKLRLDAQSNIRLKVTPRRGKKKWELIYLTKKNEREKIRASVPSKKKGRGRE